MPSHFPFSKLWLTAEFPYPGPHQNQSALLSITIALVAGTPLLSILLVLLGAPLTTHHAHTVLLGAHLALLSGPALVYARGIDAKTWRHIAALLVPLDDVMGATVGTLLGAWVGAVPIPLDW